MRKGIKVGACVTAKCWYMPRVYGKIIEYCGGNRWAVQGLFGLAEFHGSQLKPSRRAESPHLLEAEGPRGV